MRRFVLLLLLALKCMAESYTPPQLPRLSAITDGDLLMVWNGTNLYHADTTNFLTSDVLAGYLPSSSGTGTNETFTGTTTLATTTIAGALTVSSPSKLRVDPSAASGNGRVGFFGTPTAPLDYIGNNIKLGGDDGAVDLHTKTVNANKRLFLFSPNYAADESSWLKYDGTSTADVLYLGYGPSGYYPMTGVWIGAVTNKGDTVSSIAVPIKVAGTGTTLGVGLTVNSVGSIPLVVDSSNYRVGIGNTPSRNFEVVANLIKMGADDGANTLYTKSANTDKLFALIAPDRINDEAGVFRYDLATSANTLRIGAGIGGLHGATAVTLSTYPTVSSTTVAEHVRVNASGQVIVGSTSTDSSSKFTVVTTTQGTIPFPKQTTAQISAVSSKVDGLGFYDTDKKRLVTHDGSVDQTYVVRADSNPTTSTLSYSGTTVTVTAGGQKNYSHRLTVTNDFTLTFSGVTDGDSGLIRCFAANTNCTVTLSSPAFGPSGATLTITAAASSLTNHSTIAWSCWNQGSTNRIDVNVLPYYR